MKERKIKVLFGCRTYGTTDLQLGNICNNPECSTCSNFKKAFKEEVERQLLELEDKPTIPKLDPDKMVEYRRPEGITREHIRKAVEYIFNQQDEESNKES